MAWQGLCDQAASEILAFKTEAKKRVDKAKNKASVAKTYLKGLKFAYGCLKEIRDTESKVAQSLLSDFKKLSKKYNLLQKRYKLLEARYGKT